MQWYAHSQRITKGGYEMTLRVLTLFCALVLGGCVSAQFRTSTDMCVEQVSDSETCSSSSFVRLASEGASQHAALGFVEFNDEGVAYDQRNIDSVLSSISDMQSTESRSLLMVVFIHGWNHNAAQSDRNVVQFKDFLRNLQTEELALVVGQPRRVVGLYVGWQARAFESPFLSLFSYRRKKELGLKTGQSVTPVLQQLASLRAADRQSRLVVVGHSFGGGLLYSAVENSLVSTLRAQDRQPGKIFGDLVVLINPATEAALFTSLHDAMQKPFLECAPLSLISFTSEADTALSREFPRGMRLFYSDKIKGDASDAMLTTPYGLFDEYARYELRPEPNWRLERFLSKDIFNRAVPLWGTFRQGGEDFNLGGIRLKLKSHGLESPWKPVLNVLVDASLMSEHNEIWNPGFTYFLRGLVGMEFARSRRCL
jgi:pimeloyl-ACP methyl ester carboxylesterase